ncbi:hypothetical protein [Millisia brevis]|uniref:hypothetical protein n=1 Tax=Millisia brevis TaxID=264148 RepID=UPI00082D8997|nr:hypothetical protein [Millisia brevis]
MTTTDDLDRPPVTLGGPTGDVHGDTGALFVVDRIVDLVPGERAAGVRLVPMSLDVFDSHFPRFPVLPGVLILGSVAALAARVLAAAESGRWTLVGVGRARYRHYVRPGDIVEMQVTVRSLRDGRATCSGTVAVDGSSVATFGSLTLTNEESANEESVDGGAS